MCNMFSRLKTKHDITNYRFLIFDTIARVACRSCVTTFHFKGFLVFVVFSCCSFVTYLLSVVVKYCGIIIYVASHP